MKRASLTALYVGLLATGIASASEPSTSADPHAAHAGHGTHTPASKAAAHAAGAHQHNQATASGASTVGHDAHSAAPGHAHAASHGAPESTDAPTPPAAADSAHHAAGHTTARPAPASRDPHAGHTSHVGHAATAPATTPAHSPAGTEHHHAHHPADKPADTPAPTPAADVHADHSAHSNHAPHGAAPVTGGHVHDPAQHAHGNAPAEPLPALTAADHAAAFPALDHHAMQHASSRHFLVLLDQLEGWDNTGSHGQSWNAQAWVGSDLNRVWLRSAGQREGGQRARGQHELLYGRAISPWWDVVAGVSYADLHHGRAQTRLAIGVQGLAPYKLETTATAYLGGRSRASLALEVEYDVLLTNRLILQPSLHAQLSARADPHRGIGQGLNEVEAGLRLRYEIRRRFAPYVGYVHARELGQAQRWQRRDGQPVSTSRWVAGVRVWF